MKCIQLTRKGRQCGIPGEAARDGYCHVHDPKGNYQRQHKKLPKVNHKEPTGRAGRIPANVLRLYFDGGITVNPGGTAKYGFVIRRGGTIISQGSGIAMKGEGATVNIAEWTGLLMGLFEVYGWCLDDEPLWIMGDSKLVINQASGRWKIKVPHFAELFKMCKEAASKLNIAKWRWIPRLENNYADGLAWKATGEPVFVYSDLYFENQQ